MARRVRVEEIVETDRIDGVPHPRETTALLGQDAALARAARAIRSGRPPQAWLITGPPGVGKATFAYRIARYLLHYGATDRGAEDLALAPGDPDALQVKAGAHPGLIVLKRGISATTGKPMTVLNVDEVRRLGNFFGLTSGAGGWRVAIVDTADDMNDNAANALLKVLEEPPRHAMLLLVANAPARLLPTIRSRCQRLDLKPLGSEQLDAELTQRLPALSAAERASLVRLSDGSIGAALRLASDDGLAIATEAERLIDRAAAPDFQAALALGEKLARMDDGVESFGHFLAQALGARILARAREAAPGLNQWVELWEKFNTTFGRSVGLHLEPRQTIVSAARALSQTARRGAL
jgi:DNA polymerase-3 subunit delta'